jgi:hypothetical protein
MYPDLRFRQASAVCNAGWQVVHACRRYLVVEMGKVCAMQETRRCQLRGKRLVKRQPAQRALDCVLELHSYTQSVTALLGQKISRCQQRSKRLLSNAAARTLGYVLDLQCLVQLITASLGSFAHAAASWLVSTSAAASRRWSCICEHLQLLARPAAWREAAAAAARGRSESQQIAASAKQRPAGRQTPTKRRQPRSSPASDAAAAAQPGRQARRRLQKRAAGAQNSTAAAAPLATVAAAAAPHMDTPPVQDAAAVTDVTDMEHTTAPQEQLHGGSDLCAAEMYAAIKPYSMAEVRGIGQR